METQEITVVQVLIDKIIPPKHPAGETDVQCWVDALRGAGGLQQPLRVQRTGDERFEIIEALGAECYAACKQIGMATIPVIIVSEIDGAAMWAEAGSIEDQLRRPKLPISMRVKLVARLKDLYEELYPETKHGVMPV